VHIKFLNLSGMFDIHNIINPLDREASKPLNSGYLIYKIIKILLKVWLLDVQTYLDFHHQTKSWMFDDLSKTELTQVCTSSYTFIVYLSKNTGHTTSAMTNISLPLISSLIVATIPLTISCINDRC